MMNKGRKVSNLVLDGQLLILCLEICMILIKESFKPCFRWSAPYTREMQDSLVYILYSVSNLVLDGQILIPLFFDFI